MDDLVHEGLLEEVKERLEEFQIDGILDSGMLEQLTEDVWYSQQRCCRWILRENKDYKKILFYLSK